MTVKVRVYIKRSYASDIALLMEERSNVEAHNANDCPVELCYENFGRPSATQNLNSPNDKFLGIRIAEQGKQSRDIFAVASVSRPNVD